MGLTPHRLDDVPRCFPFESSTLLDTWHMAPVDLHDFFWPTTGKGSSLEVDPYSPPTFPQVCYKSTGHIFITQNTMDSGISF